MSKSFALPSPEPSFPGALGRGRRLAPLLELGLIASVAVAALLFQLTLPSRPPTDEQYRSVAAVLQREARAGDVLLLYPWWTERGRLFAPASVPVVGYLGSERDPLTRFSRIWVLAQPNLPRSDLRAFHREFLPARARWGEPRIFGNLQLELYRNEQYRPTIFSAVSASASARVYIDSPAGGRVECPFDGSAHRCPGPERLHVAPEWHESFFQPRFCLWMPPPGGARRLVAEFPNLPNGDRWVLEAGIVWESAPRTDPGLTTTHVGVEDTATGRELLALAIPPSIEGVNYAERPGLGLPPALGARLWIQSDNPALRDTCVELTSQGPLSVSR